jgi:putative drug exporter of the RND superfamily
VIAIAAVAVVAGSRFENDFGGVGQSQQAQNLLTHRFPAQAGDQAQVVFRSSRPVRAPGTATRISQALAAIRPMPSVTSVSPLITAADGHTALATIQFDAISARLPAADVTAVIATARSYAEPGLRIALGGAPVSAVSLPPAG